MRHAIQVAGCAGLLLLAAGGCGGVIPTPEGIFVPILQETFPAPLRTLEGSLGAGGLTDPDAPLRAGYGPDDVPWRAFTSFRMTVPADATLHRAELRLHLGEVVGDPFATLGLLFAERIDMGPTLDAADLTAPALASAIGLSMLPPGLSSLDVTALVQDALNRGETRVDIRLRFGVSVPSDGTVAYLGWTSFAVDTDPVSLPPTLVLTWR